MSTKILTNVYNAIVYYFLLYGIEIWGNASSTLLSPLLILQKKFLRMTIPYHSPLEIVNVPHNQLFHDLNILKIFDIFKLQLGSNVFKTINKIGPCENLLKFDFANDIHSYNTRFSCQNNLYRARSRTNRYGLKRIENEGAKLWNEIDLDIRTKNSKLFKKSYKKFLLTAYLS